MVVLEAIGERVAKRSSDFDGNSSLTKRVRGLEL